MENDWNGTLLDSVEAVVRTAEGMRWKGKHPLVATQPGQTALMVTAVFAISTAIARVMATIACFEAQ